MDTSSAIGEVFLKESRALLSDSLLPRIERCVEKLTVGEIWWRPNDDSNSIGNLLLHLSGNVRQWIVSGIGGAEDRRQRQQEFDERGPIAPDELLSGLRRTVNDADWVLAALRPAALLDHRTIQGHEVNVLEAIYHVVEHFSMHAGQIILLTKRVKGDLGFYDVSGGTAVETWRDQ